MRASHETAEELPDEARMKELLVDGDNAGCLHILRHSCAVNLRMVSMGFTAAVAHGCPVDTAAVQALQACADHGLSPGRRIHNNVLGVLSRVGPPEAVLAWVARMYDTGIEVDLIACNIQLKAHCALGNSEGLVGGSGTGSKLEQAVQLLSSMMRAKSDGPPAPNAISFNTVISALAQVLRSAPSHRLRACRPPHLPASPVRLGTVSLLRYDLIVALT